MCEFGGSFCLLISGLIPSRWVSVWTLTWVFGSEAGHCATLSKVTQQRAFLTSNFVDSISCK